MQYDIAIVGAGIVGLATARALLERAPRTKITLLDKEAKIAQHQTGHNSGVIHSGIYYKPGSYKAKLTVQGAQLMREFVQSRGLKTEPIGKVIVATSQAEIPRLQTLFERGTANGVAGLEMIDAARLKEIEPHAAAVKAIWSPATGIVDYGEVAETFAKELTAAGAVIQTGAGVHAIARRTDGVTLETAKGAVSARRLINCAGLYSDRIARMAGATPDVQIIPFRGEYYFIRPERRSLVQKLIYPVPDPEFPFLGVHFTRTVHGDVEAGPNAVLAFAREGYTFGRVRPGELAQTLTFPGFWHMARKYWRTGAYEVYRSLSTAAFVRALQKLVPDVTEADVIPGGAGVRAQAVASDGSLVDDFRIVSAADSIHVLNAPSPAATASLAIGRHIADLAVDTFGINT